MRLEFIDKVKEGQVLAKDILAFDGKVLLRAGISLNETYIKKIKFLGIFCIYVEDEMLDDVFKDWDSRLYDVKVVAMENMAKVVKNVRTASENNIKDLMNIVGDLIDSVINTKDVNKNLLEIQSYDNNTYLHSIDTCIMSSFLGVTAGIGGGELVQLGVAAMLHDVGKTKISKSILCKEGRLNKEEFEEMKKHAIYGSEILRESGFISDTVIESVLQHHERVDGSGYPYGLVDKEILQSSKIICICDVFDAVSSDRVYRKRIFPDEAYKIIINGQGSFFDNSLVDKFKSTFSVYPLGSCIRLSNGIEGYVIKQNKVYPDRPTIRVLYDSVSKVPVPFYEIDLMKEMELNVDSVVM